MGLCGTPGEGIEVCLHRHQWVGLIAAVVALLGAQDVLVNARTKLSPSQATDLGTGNHGDHQTCASAHPEEAWIALKRESQFEQ